MARSFTPTSIKVAPAPKATSGGLKAFEAAFREFGDHAYPRACTFLLNGVAMDGKRCLVNVLRDVLDEPQPWILRGIAYEKASLEPFNRANGSGREANAGARVCVKAKQGNSANGKAAALN